MKKLLMLLPAAAFMFLLSCGNSTGENKDSADTHDHESMTMHGSAAHNADVDPSNVDPICEMLRDDSWTDYMVYNEDTVWFCSEFCKDAFAANPEKYRH
jgi:YHS domain-containing protein